MREKSKTFRINYTTQAAYMVKFSARSDSKNFPLKNWLCYRSHGVSKKKFICHHNLVSLKKDLYTLKLI